MKVLSPLEEIPDSQKVQPKTRIFTVGELTKHIKEILESDMLLNDLWVRGEVSNLTEHGSGHIYFSLKDEKSQIRCALFRRVNVDMNFKIEHGMKLLIRGAIEVYEPHGIYSIIVEEVQPDGIGALNLAFNQLKNRLEKEGLFSEKFKKELPKFPRTIGVITSSTGAVIQDMLNIIRKRYPPVNILVAPTVVQGKEASKSIVDSIRMMNELSYPDVIILGRGGGSMEDLWAFNEEIVAREIFKSEIPIISAVGHETDFTISDFVADYRAPTPSAAAQRVVPDLEEVFTVIENLKVRHLQAVRNTVEYHKSYLEQVLSRRIFRKPLERINNCHQKLDAVSYRIQSVMSKQIILRKGSVEINESKINALNPKAVLERGYSIVMKGGKIIKSFSDVKLEEEIDIVLHKGQIGAKVKKIKRG